MPVLAGGHRASRKSPLHLSGQLGGPGAFLIAWAGVLNGRRTTTDRGVSDEPARPFSDINLHSSETLVKDGHVITAGGGTSAIEVALSSVAEDHGRGVAQQTARFAELQTREARGLALRRLQQQAGVRGARPGGRILPQRIRHRRHNAHVIPSVRQGTQYDRPVS
ncbi:hypothetical protein [Streptomyces sp. NPDC058307]|uniref:hypothetical protein n=1 Tax=Streptomyces sp. NPDC058307 TaxID=3346439 RepID=UPI0036E70EC2